MDWLDPAIVKVWPALTPWAVAVVTVAVVPTRAMPLTVTADVALVTVIVPAAVAGVMIEVVNENVLLPPAVSVTAGLL